MPSKALTPEEYIHGLPEDRKQAFRKLLDLIRRNLPGGFEETMSYGMIGFVVPHSLYAPGYHVNPKLPLPFINLASQKNYIALYHLGLYADQGLLQWFKSEYFSLFNRKPDMGKSCIRFKNPDNIPYEIIEKLVKKMSAREWIDLYEKARIS